MASGEGLKLFVGGISRKTTDTDLRDYFENRFGTLADFVIMKEPNGGESRGFGFVTFEKKDDYEQVIKAKKDLTLDGRRLDVKPALPKGVPVPGYKSRMQRMREERVELGGENGNPEQNGFFAAGWAQQAAAQAQFYNYGGPGGGPPGGPGGNPPGAYPPPQQPTPMGGYSRTPAFYPPQYPPQPQPQPGAPYFASSTPQTLEQAAAARASAAAAVSPPMQHLAAPVPQLATVAHPQNPVPFQSTAPPVGVGFASALAQPQPVNLVHAPTPFVNPYAQQVMAQQQQQQPRPVASPVPMPPSPSPSPQPTAYTTPTRIPGTYAYANGVARPVTPQPLLSPTAAGSTPTAAPMSSPQQPHAYAAPAAAPNVGSSGTAIVAAGANQNIEVLQAQQRRLAEQYAQLQSQIVAAASVAMSSQSVGHGVAPTVPLGGAANGAAGAPVSSTGQPTTAAVPTLPTSTGLNGTMVMQTGAAATMLMQQQHPQTGGGASTAGGGASSQNGTDKSGGGGYGPSAKGRQRSAYRPY